MDFKGFNTRNYRILPVKEGYTEWSGSYNATVPDELDIRLLNRIATVSWSEVKRAVDLACGTGRTGEWLKSRGAAEIVGVDFTAGMINRASERNIYSGLHLKDITDTGLSDGQYDLVIEVLADEHLKSLYSLYNEAFRICCPGGHFVLVGYHPYFLMEGIITHFHRPSGEPVGIESYIHQLSDHVKAAVRAGWSLREMDEGLVDDHWIHRKPKWEHYRNRPVSFSFVWKKG